MTTQTEKPLYIHSLEIQNFLGIKYLQVDLNGRSLEVVGSNGVGKTSFMNTLDQLFGGTDLVAIPEPIHSGERVATLKCDLGEFLLRKRYAHGKDGKLNITMEVTHPDGSKARTYDGRPVTPMEFVRAIVGNGTLDPVAF